MRSRLSRLSPALRFVLLVGVMSFFADFTYEGSRSIIGQYLGLLGAGALAISVVTGFGELLGYGLPLFSGRGADRTGLYWPITIGGYVLQMSVVPLLALAGSWQIAALLIILERNSIIRSWTSRSCPNGTTGGLALLPSTDRLVAERERPPRLFSQAFFEPHRPRAARAPICAGSRGVACDYRLARRSPRAS